jgi:hypothetical protein
MINEPKHIRNEYYIEEDFADLAGYYETGSKLHQRMLASVIKDMERGKIEYRIVSEVIKRTDRNGNVHDVERVVVQRKGMILPKRATT